MVLEITLHGCRWPVYSEAPTPAPAAIEYQSENIYIFMTDIEKDIQSSLSPSDRDIHRRPSLSKETLHVRQHFFAETLKRHAAKICFGTSYSNLKHRLNQYGRPLFYHEGTDLPVHLSVSHTGRHVMLAFAPYSCGIDIEKVAAPSFYPNIVKRGLPQNWADELALRSEHADTQAMLFTAYWTALESLFKMSGNAKSLYHFLRDVAAAQDKPEYFQSWTHYWGRMFKIDSEHIACITLQQKPAQVLFHTVQLPDSSFAED